MNNTGLYKLSDVHLKWVYSRDIERAKRFSTLHSIKHNTNNFSDITTDNETDCVLIPNRTFARHIDLALQACRSGKHVLIEKPIDIDIEKVDAFYNEFKDSNLTINVVSQYLFDAEIVKIKDQLSHIKCDSISAICHILQYRDKPYYENGNGWRKHQSHAVLNQGIHWIDVLHYLLGNVTQVTSTSTKTKQWLHCDNYQNSLLHFENGANVSFICSTGLNPKNRSHSKFLLTIRLFYTQRGRIY